jgi:hypothetical protein
VLALSYSSPHAALEFLVSFLAIQFNAFLIRLLEVAALINLGSARSLVHVAILGVEVP